MQSQPVPATPFPQALRIRVGRGLLHSFGPPYLNPLPCRDLSGFYYPSPGALRKTVAFQLQKRGNEVFLSRNFKPSSQTNPFPWHLLHTAPESTPVPGARKRPP